jgi:hypothetical protein
MDVCVSSLSVLFHADNSLATGLITCPRSPTVCKIYFSRVILMGNRPDGFIREMGEVFNNI